MYIGIECTISSQSSPIMKTSPESVKSVVMFSSCSEILWPSFPKVVIPSDDEHVPQLLHSATESRAPMWCQVDENGATETWEKFRILKWRYCTLLYEYSP